MEEHSRPTTFGDLKALIPALNQKDAQYLLISDHALFAHGYHRATTNIDPLVLASNAAGESIRDALLPLLAQAAGEIDPGWLEEGDNIGDTDAFVVDLMLNACGKTHESLHPVAHH